MKKKKEWMPEEGTHKFPLSGNTKSRQRERERAGGGKTSDQISVTRITPGLKPTRYPTPHPDGAAAQGRGQQSEPDLRNAQLRGEIEL